MQRSVNERPYGIGEAVLEGAVETSKKKASIMMVSRQVIKYLLQLVSSGMNESTYIQITKPSIQMELVLLSKPLIQ